MDSQRLLERLQEFFPDSQIQVKDLTGGGDYWQVQVKSTLFRGKSLVEQHQMVYQAVGEWMKKDIHALQLDTQEL